MTNSRSEVSELSKRATEILSMLSEEKICSSNTEREGFGSILDAARQLTGNYAARMLAPGLTSCVATTLLKVGLCQELSQRFVLEYCIKYREKNISLVFLSNPEQGYSKHDHVFVVIGSIKAPDNLILGRDPSGVYIDPKKNMTVKGFLETNSHCVIADPLLNCAGTSEKEISPFLDYCKRYRTSHVVGVRPFINTPNFIESVERIKKNAEIVAKQVSADLEKAAKSEDTARIRRIAQSLDTERKLDGADFQNVFVQAGLERSFSKNRKTRILSIGCGFAEELVALNAMSDNFQYVGVDIDNSSIKFCKQTYKNDKKANFYAVDANNLKTLVETIGREKFDVILLIHPIMTPGNPASAVFENMITHHVPRLLNFDGDVLACFHSKEEFAQYRKIMQTNYDYNIRSEFNRPDKRSCQYVCRASVRYEPRVRQQLGESTTLINKLCSISGLKFVGLHDKEYRVDAIAELDSCDSFRNAYGIVDKLKSGLLFCNDGKHKIVLKDINCGDEDYLNGKSLSMRINES